MKQNFKEFIEFIRTKGVIGLAVAVIIGVAVTDTVNALVEGIINPLIALFLPADKLEQATFTVGESVFQWGTFTGAVINLIIIAAIVYFGVKALGLEELNKNDGE